jgi:protein arginine kinase
MKVSDFLAQKWLGGDDSVPNIVFSSRIRLARNLRAYPFPMVASEAQKLAVEKFVREAVSRLHFDEPIFEFPLAKMSELEKLFLLECHMISQEHAMGEGERSVLISEGARISLMINEEDHLRIQVLSLGFNLKSSWDFINKFDDDLMEHLDIAFSPERGFLTECPTNVGTGMRASAMMHLPAIVFLKKEYEIFKEIAKLGIAIRGIYGEGSQFLGQIFQVSNQVTLGVSEEDIVRNMENVIKQIVSHEYCLREQLLAENRLAIEDKVFRAWGVLQNARLLSFQEAIDLLSTIWLGCGINILSGLDKKEIFELFFRVQPGHIQMMEGRLLSPELRDKSRAALVRTHLRIGI